MAGQDHRLRRIEVLNRRRAALLGAVLTALGVLLGAQPASAHVVPAAVVELDVHERDITATLVLPAEDLRAASGITVPAAGALPSTTAARLAAYIKAHLAASSDGRAWDVQIAGTAQAGTTQQYGTGNFPAVSVIATLTPPSPNLLRAFTLHDDVIVHQVVTADTFVVLHSDWAAGQFGAARSLGSIATNTVTGTVPDLPIALNDGSPWQGFIGMVSLGVSHIAEGIDHQLFLLTLLLPAPLLAAAGRWTRTAGTGRTARRITTITLAFTIGHSITLALGALGLPVPQQAVEAAIAISILVAAAHAVRPLFPGREALVAGLFGLVHGLAFSATLSALDLTGGQLVLSLLGFNLGIELMQLAVVLIVLPPLIVLARSPLYPPLRVTAAFIVGVAAVCWLLDRTGLPNAGATIADSLGVTSPYLAAALWLIAAAVLTARARGRRSERRLRADPPRQVTQSSSQGPVRTTTVRSAAGQGRGSDA